MLAFVLPMAVGGGETLIPDLPMANLPIQTLLLIAVVRFVGTMASYPVGVPAGIFSPMLTFATTVGLIFGLLIEMALIHSPLAVPPLIGAAFAVAAMGGLFSADHPRAAGRRRAGGRADRRLRADPAADGDLHDGARRRPRAGRPADLRGAAGALGAAGRTGPRAPSTATSSPVGIDDPPHRRALKKQAMLLGYDFLDLLLALGRALPAASSTRRHRRARW